MEHLVNWVLRIVDLDCDRRRIQPVELEERAHHLVESGPRTGKNNGSRGRAWSAARVCVIRVDGCVDAGKALSTPHEVEERVPSGIRDRLVIWIIKKRTCRAV